MNAATISKPIIAIPRGVATGNDVKLYLEFFDHHLLETIIAIELLAHARLSAAVVAATSAAIVSQKILDRLDEALATREIKTTKPFPCHPRSGYPPSELYGIVL